MPKDQLLEREPIHGKCRLARAGCERETLELAQTHNRRLDSHSGPLACLAVARAQLVEAAGLVMRLGLGFWDYEE